VKILSNIIEGIEKYTVMLLVAGMALILFANVIYRYFLNAPIYWANEASIYMMAWLTFLGGSLGLKYKTQAAITFVVERLSVNNKKILSIVTHVLMLAFLGFLLYVSYSWIFSLSGSVSSSMRIPMWIPYSAVPVGLTFAFIHLTEHLINFIKGSEESEDSI
jgi:C4-dicarboxylate transporter DctQ subunit